MAINTKTPKKVKIYFIRIKKYEMFILPLNLLYLRFLLIISY